MSRFSAVNLLEVEDSVGERAPGLEGRFGRKHLDSRDLGVRATLSRSGRTKPPKMQATASWQSCLRVRRNS
jgi:hypothetical protein